MIDLIEHIEHLLRRHDCVIVPGLGALLACRHPAEIAADGRLFLPPRRTVSFNPAVSHNDGLLQSSLMRRHGLTEATAGATLADSVSALNNVLQRTGRLSLGRIGILSPLHPGGALAG